MVELVLRAGDAESRAVFEDIFAALVRCEQPQAAECIFALTATEVYPWFTHSFHRLNPLSAVVEDGERTVRRGDIGYWGALGARLHWVNNETLARVEIDNPGDYAEAVHATAAPHQHGWLFDCGWSQARHGFPE